MGARPIVVVFVLFSLSLCQRVDGSGCQHDCNCGFRVDGAHAQDESATLRHEVLGGLCGAFGPLLIGVASYLAYKRCSSPCTSRPRGGGMGTPDSSRYPPWDDGSNSTSGDRSHNRVGPGGRPMGPGGGGGGGGQFGSNRPRMSSPTSMYGELDSELYRGGQPPPPPPSYSANPANSLPGSKWINIHKSVQADHTNAWLKNVNKIKQFH